jgi:hypothetical protein
LYKLQFIHKLPSVVASESIVSSPVKLHTCALRFSQEKNRDFRVHYEGPQKS